MIPKKFKLGGHEYEVKCPHIFEENTRYSGLHQYGLKRILVGGGLSPTVQFQVFMHEVIHAIDHTFCMESIGSEVPVERLVDGIAEGLTQFLLENGFWKV